MRKLLFFSRVAFICNVCFLFTFGMHFYPLLPDGNLSSTVIVLGYGMGFLLNAVMTLLYTWHWLRRRLPEAGIPHWLVTANLLFLIPEIVIIAIQ